MAWRRLVTNGVRACPDTCSTTSMIRGYQRHDACAVDEVFRCRERPLGLQMLYRARKLFDDLVLAEAGPRVLPWTLGFSTFRRSKRRLAINRPVAMHYACK